jgi:hypothetical protein
MGFLQLYVASDCEGIGENGQQNVEKQSDANFRRGGVENIDLLWKQHFIVKCFRNDTGWSRRVLRTFYESFDKSWLTV